MASALALAASLLLSAVSAQQMGNYTKEVHPTLVSYKCTIAGGCKAVNTSVVLDAGYRWSHSVGGYDACSPNGFNTSICPNEATCAKNCALEGVDYKGYGITTNGDSLKLDLYVTENNVTKKASPRAYLLNEEGDKYDMMSLLNKEISFDVDMSKVGCQVNGALYLSEMLANGGKSHLNPAGAAYGTGYCDAQCPVQTWINGVANINNTYGACCQEMDLWEANREAAAFTPHPCNTTSLYKCEGLLCGSGSHRYEGVCDEDGCGFNSYKNGAQNFLGVGANHTVDTSKMLTVVTQFLTDNNKTTGNLTEIRRVYVQGGVVIQNSKVNVQGQAAVNSIDDTYCTSDKFKSQGAMAGMGKAIGRGMVLIFSIWDDASGGMLWLDGNPSSTNDPAQANGACPSTPILNEGDLMKAYPDSSVTFSNIKSGELGSTFGPQKCHGKQCHHH